MWIGLSYYSLPALLLLFLPTLPLSLLFSLPPPPLLSFLPLFLTFSLSPSLTPSLPPLSSRYFNEFLMAHSRDTAQQVHKEYVDTMGKMYYSYFKDYHSKLMKLQVSRTLVT